MVSICTTRLNSEKCTFCPHSVCVCVCVCVCVFTPSQQETSIISSYSTQRLVFLMAVHILPPKMPKQWLYIQPVMQNNFSVQGRAMPTSHHRSPISIPSKPIWGLFVDKVALEQDYFWPIRFYSVSATPPLLCQCHSTITLSVPLHHYSVSATPPLLRTTSSSSSFCCYQMDKRANTGNQPLTKAMLFRISAINWQAGKNFYTVV